MSFYAKKWAVPYLTPSISSVLLAKSPAHARLACPYFPEYAPMPASAAMAFGTLVDELVLGDNRKIAVVNFDDWRKKEARAAATEARQAGLIPVLAGDFDRAARIAGKIREKIKRGYIAIDACWLRRRLFWDDGAVSLSGEPDIVLPGGDGAAIIDIKTTAIVPTADNWTRHVAAMSYDIQAAAYCEAVKSRTFLWLVAESAPPHSVVLHRATPTLLASGQRRWDEAKRIWGECIATNNWPGPDDGEIDPAPWMIDQQEIIFTEEAE